MAVLAGAAAFAAAVSGVALEACAQSPGDLFGETVSWTLSAPSGQAVKAGGQVVLTLQGKVQDGWHVYGLTQRADGPTPLKVSLEATSTVTAAAAPKASPPVKKHDPSFGFETQYYAGPFTVDIPVKIASRAAAGRQLVAVNVRFQTCDGHICQPPKTVRLSAPIAVQ